MMTPEEHRKIDAVFEREAAKRRKRPFVHQGVDLQVEIGRMLKQLELNGTTTYLGRVVGKPQIKIRHSAKPGYRGRGGPLRVVITIGRNASVPDVLELLLHELCHTAMVRRGRNVHHDSSFIALVVHSAKALWGVEVDDWEKIERGNHRKRAYAVDYTIVKKLYWRIKRGEYVPTQAPPPPVPLSRAERAAEHTAEREAHARKKLEEHQKKLTREQKLVRKWRQKVAYYARKK